MNSSYLFIIEGSFMIYLFIINGSFMNNYLLYKEVA